MKAIKLLPSNIVNQIAAGEILDRPYSAIKELVENSIDASATKIDIYLTDGGKNQITILDNGKGMSKEDMYMSYIRHATSKFTDFDNIATFGFRGEALASIASVSKMIITSRQEGDKYSHTLVIEEGEIVKEYDGFDDKGTKIEIFDLFHNTPTRLKFMKSTSYELGLILKVIKQFAILFTHIEFTCSHNNKMVFSTLADNDRVSLILGENFMHNAMKIDYSYDNIAIQGYASLPTYTKTNSDSKWIFVNNRLIQDKIFHQAISAAYKDVISAGAYPIVFLHITMPLDEVDINVHPQKKEARFLSSQNVHKAIFNGLTEAIYKNGKRSVSFFVEEAPTYVEPFTFKEKNLQFHEEEAVFTPEVVYKPIVESAPISHFKEAKPLVLQEISLGTPIGQFANKYIVAVNNDELVLIDQHACHERVLYEKLKNEYYSKQINSQILLAPLKLNLCEVTQEEELKLVELGFKLKIHAGEIYLLEHPVIVTTNFEEIIMSILENRNKDINYIIANIACKNAIKSGMNFTMTEMNSFLRLVEKTDMVGQCNHGRPSYIKFHISKIDNLFNRT